MSWTISRRYVSAGLLAAGLHASFIGSKVWRRCTILSLSPRMISQSRVIAKGLRIRDVQRLVTTYGGRSSQWAKKSSPRLEDEEGPFEIHWYEHPGIGRVELKKKQVIEP